ncbi:MAG: hypothetical protein ABIL16_04845 [candidate division WOR-3 bacterium]
MRKRVVILLGILSCSEYGIFKDWEKRAQKEPISVLREIGDSLRSPKFKRKMATTPLGPKVLDLAIKISKDLDYYKLPIDSLVKCSDGLKSVVLFVYDFGIFDERWSDVLFAYREILRAALYKMENIDDLDSLERITYALQPPLMAGIYKKEYEKLIDLYRSKSVANGEIRWGMGEGDVIEAWGEPDSVDTVYSISNASFGKILYWKDRGKGVLILDGRVEDVFEQ